MFEGVWWDLLFALIGTGAMVTGIVGLAMGGNLPGVRVPQSLRPLAKFLLTLALLVGITLVVDKGSPDLLERLLNEIVS
ncbi:MAG: hypothetical protein LOD85_07265 [Clostridia bacterium]|jgi:hypothetical protein|nr:hypothetical protein [Bacillota bacterium]MBO2521535.1 hypothetical protein [Bacillota bacterium]